MKLFDLLRAKKNLEIEVENLSRKVSFFQEDKARLISQLKEDHQREVEKLRKESEIKFQELKSLADLDRQQQIAEITLRAQANQNDMETKNAKALAALESKLAKDYYDKMTSALKDMTLNGSEQSKFVQEMALKMLDKGLEKPMPSHYIMENRLPPKG